MNQSIEERGKYGMFTDTRKEAGVSKLYLKGQIVTILGF